MKAPFKGCDFREYPAGSVTQFFGENPALYAKMGLTAHNGCDLVSAHGTQLYAVETGTVCDVKLSEDGYGRHLRIIGSSKNGLCNVWTYGHCDTITVKVGDEVKEGDPIATMGNTGFVVSGATPYWKSNPFAGTHLHLGLRKAKRSVKGWNYEGSKIKILIPEYENGYKGSIDPLPYFTDVKPDIAKLEAQVSLLQKVVELYKQLRNIK